MIAIEQTAVSVRRKTGAGSISFGAIWKWIVLGAIILHGSRLLAQSENWVVYNTGNSDVPNDVVKSIAFTSTGDAWIGTFGSGLAVHKSQTAPFAPELLWTHEAPALIEWCDRWEDGFATGDLDDDGVPDVVFGTAGGAVVAVDGSSGDSLWTYTVANTRESVNADIIDVDGDGVLDVVAGGKASSGNTTVVALNRDRSLKWQASGDYQETNDFAYGDINGDGFPDVAAAIGTYSRGGGQVIVFDGRNGDKIWDAALGSGTPFAVDARDIDDDGDMEIAVTNYDNKVFLLDGATNTVLWSKAGIYYGRDVLFANVDDDALFEIVSVMGNVYCHDSDGNPDWSNTSGVGENLMACNPDGDDDVEILIANPWTGNTSLVEGATGTVIWTRSEAGLADVGDIDGDGQDEIVAVSTKYYDPNFPTQHVRAVDSGNNLLWEHELPEEPSAVVLANIDRDAAEEILVAYASTLIALDIVPTRVGEPAESAAASGGYRLWQNYPNPFNALTTIRFCLPETDIVTLKIYDVLGREVATLIDDKYDAGDYEVHWNANNFASGVYLVAIRAGGYFEMKKMALLK
jgi:outer membrane protein assembly factor BamB